MVLDIINFLFYLSDIWPDNSMTASALSKNEEKLYTLVLSWFFSTCSHRPWITSLTYNNNHLADCLFWERIFFWHLLPLSREVFELVHTHAHTAHLNIHKCRWMNLGAVEEGRMVTPVSVCIKVSGITRTFHVLGNGASLHPSCQGARLWLEVWHVNGL